MKQSAPYIIIMIFLMGIFYYMHQVGKSIPIIGYVDSNELYQGFEPYKVWDAKLKEFGNIQKGILDSIELELVGMGDGKDTRFVALLESYRVREKQFTENYKQMELQSEKEISTQLNQYVKDYSDKNGFDMIFGANGNGSMMAAREEKFNITKEVLEYANKRYQGFSD